MCRMIAIASKYKPSPLYFEDFHKLAIDGKVKENMEDSHKDGWGIAGYLGKWAVHFGRSEKGADIDNVNYEIAARKAVISGSKIILGHLRKGSEGMINNSHPFIYKDWIFCHNGTIFNSEKLIIPGHNYEGTTDSERFFIFLINKLERRTFKEYSEILKKTIEEIKQKCGYTSLTFILSNSNYLLSYRDYNEEENYYTLYYSYASNTILFCSEPLPGFDWISLKNKELIVVQKEGNLLKEF